MARIFNVPSVVPALPDPLTSGTTVVFRTPGVITSQALAGVFFQVGTATAVAFERPGGVTPNVSNFRGDQAYMAVYNGSTFELLDNTISLPAGGAAGLCLAKASTADFDYEFVVCTDDQTAAEVAADVSNFGTNIPLAATNVQAALDALDDIESTGLSSTIPPPVALAGVLGASDDAAHGDHTHATVPVHISSGEATQTGRTLTLPSVSPTMPASPAVGTVIVFKTPDTLTEQATEGVFLSISGTSFTLHRPPNNLLNVGDLNTETPYVAVYNGAQFELIDDTISVPSGGTDTQVLAKASDDSWDLEWVDPPTGGGLDQGQVDARVQAGVKNYARTDLNFLINGADIAQNTIPSDRIQDNTIVAADVAASLLARMLPDGGAAGQVLTKDSGTDYDISWQASSGTGVTTYLGLSDTPNVFTNQALNLVRVNAAADALEFINPSAPSHQIVNVGRLPDPSLAGSPDLVYLTHDYTEGTKQDPTFTVGFDGGLSGYSDGTYLQQTFGTINENSPLNALFGSGDSTDYSLQSVISFNRSWLDEFTHIEIDGTEYPLNPSFVSLGAYERRIQGNPTGLSDATLTINFKRADDTWYFTDGGDLIHEAGLYERVGNPPAYHDLAPIEDTHRSGSGTFACGASDPPTDGGQVCIDSDGMASFSTDRTVLFTTDPEITATSPFMSSYWTGASSNILGFNNDGQNGEFMWYVAGDDFLQIQGTRATATFNITGTENTVIPEGTVFERTDVTSTTRVRTTAEVTIPVGDVVNNVPVEAISPGETGNNIPAAATWAPEPALTGVTSAVIQTGFSGGSGEGLVTATWEGIWTWIATIDGGDPPADQTIHETLRDDSVFLGEFSQQQDAADDRDSYMITTDRYFYILHGEEDDLQEITGFTASVSEERPDHRWVGPVITIEGVHDVFEVNADGDPQPLSLSNVRVGDNIYTAIVRVDPDTGFLRDPVASDYDTATGDSRVVGFDGAWRKVGRDLTPGHSASADDTIYIDGREFTFGGRTYRYRDEHHGDLNVHNARNLDFYWDLNSNRFRWCFTTTGSNCRWSDMHTDSNHFDGLFYQDFNFIGYFGSRDEALAHVTASDQSVVYARAGGWDFNRFTNFVPAQADEYTYRWRDVFPADDPERLIVGPNRDTGILRPPTADDYNASVAKSRVLAFDGETTLRVGRRVEGSSQATGTFTTVADETAIDTTYRWRGTHWQDYLVDSPADGDVYYNRTQAFRVRSNGVWGPASASLVFANIEYLGAFNTLREALDHATENGQWALIVVGGVPIMQSLSGFTAATAAHYVYFWTPITPPITLPPVPFPAEQDQIVRWSDADSGYVATQIETGASIDGIGTAADPLVVNAHDVIETLTEHIRYYHGDPQDITNRGATVCEVYLTGPYQYGVTHIRVGIDAPAAGAHYRGRIYTLQDNNVIMAKLADTPERGFSSGGQSHYLYFDSHGVVVEGNTRVAICVSRTRVDNDRETRLYFGNEAADSPEESYPDASEDWDRLGWVHYQHVDPAVGNDTHQHDTDGNAQIHGNIEIYYTRTINHGALLNADRVDLDHLNDDVLARLLPGSPGDNQIARYDAATSAWMAEDLPAGAGTPDDRSVTLAKIDPTGSTDGQIIVSTGPLTDPVWEDPTGGGLATVMTDATLSGDGSAGDPLGVANPFTNAESARLLPDSPTDGQVAIWDDGTTAWVATDRTGNVTVDGIVLVDDATYGWQVEDGPSQEVHFSRPLETTDDELLLHIDWRGWETTDPGVNYRDAGASVLAQHVRALAELPPLTLTKTAGGRSPIDRSMAIAAADINGAVTFKFPVADDDNNPADMRLVYIGDHIDDTNETVDDSETDIDVGSSAGMVVGRDYWIVGPIQDPGCSGTHAEKITLTAIVSDDEIRATRAVDGTGIDTNCQFVSGADVIEDNKRYFTLVNSDDGQANAVMSFTLLPSGGTGGGGSGSGLLTGSAFPASPSDDDVFLFNDAATGLTDTYDFDGTTAITTAARGDTFKYVASTTRWVRQAAGFNLSDAVPVDVDGTVDRAGTSPLASRSDHQHEIGNNEILTQNIASNQIENRHMRDDAISLAEMADNSVGSPQYIDGSIDPEHLSTSANWTLSTGGDETALIVQATAADSAAVLRINTGTAGDMKAFQAGRAGESLAWASFEGSLGGSGDNPGIALGPGGSDGRDVQLYRGGADMWLTPDAFQAGSLAVASTGLAATQANLGIIEYETGTAFPTDAAENDLFEFNDTATGLTGAVDYDGSTAITTAARGDVFKRVGTNWVKQSASGSGGGTTVAANPAGVDATATRLSAITIGGTNYNAADVVFADPTTGVLRAAAATDWNTTTSQSRVVAFDGVDLYRAARQLTGAHTASATFTAIAADATIPATTEQCIWREFHHSDSLATSSPVVNNCYYNLRSNTWRWYYSNGWFDVTSYHVFRGLTFQGIHSTEAEALAAITADGQYVAYTNASGDHVLATTSAFVAGDPGHYEYVWKDARAGLAPDEPRAGIVYQKHLASTSTAHSISNDTWVTILTQSVTVSGATDRVYVDANISVGFLAEADTVCDVRLLRGADAVGSESRGAAGFANEIHLVTFREIDTPGVGTHAYAIQVQEDDSNSVGTCSVNTQGTTSFATFEILGPN